MKTLILSILAALLLSACAMTPQQAAMWQQGMNNLAAHNQAKVAVLQNGAAQIARPAPYNRPVTTNGTIMTPSGQMYLYNSTSY